MSVAFTVSEAGCESCARIVERALAPLGPVESVDVDEAADEARVRLAGDPSEDDVNAALAGASAGAGHAYRVRPGSWRAA